MRNFCLSALVTVALCTTALLPASKVSGQSAPEPAVVVSLAPMGEQMNDIKYLVKASGFGNMNFLIQSQIKHFTAGIDRKRPSGAMLFFEEDDPQPKWLAFVAIEDVESLLDRIADFADVDEGDDYTTITPGDGQEILLKQVDDYLYVADNEEMFQMIPAAPQTVLGDLPTNYNLAARVFGQRIPEALRQKGIALIMEGYERQMEELGEESDEFLDTQMEQIKSFVNDTEEIMIGFNADKETGLLSSKTIIRGTPGSELAKRCNVMKDIPKTRFAGFINPEAAFNASIILKIIEEDIESYNGLLDQARDQAIGEIDADGELSDEEITKLESVADDLVAVLKETIATGEMDGGAVMKMQKGSMNFASGLKISDPQKLEKSIKSLIEMAQEKADTVLDVKFNSGNYDDVAFHTVSVSIPDDEEETQKVFGDSVQVIIGIGKETAYLAFGKDPLTTLTSSIEQSKTAEQPKDLNQYNVYLSPILRFASGVTAEPALDEMAETLEESGKDRISVFSNVIENGVESRFEMQDGILALISAAVKAAQAGAFQGDVDEF